MMHGHYDTETLARYVNDPKSIPDVDDLEEHLLECEECGDFVGFLANFEETWNEELPNPETWQAVRIAGESTVPPQGLRELREQLRIEDAAAAYVLDPVIGSPAAFAQANIVADTRFYNIGVARRLVAASERARETRPVFALALADAAVAISRGASLDRYEFDLLETTRGSALREQANALRYVGRYADGLEAVAAAEQCFRRTAHAEFDLARVDFVRGTLLVKIERPAEALPLARSSRATFRAFGDVQRWIEAGFLEGGVHFVQKDFRAALAVFLEVLGPAKHLDDPETLGRLYNNIAATYQELDEPALAAPFLRDAFALYEYLGMEIEKLRAAWNLALLGAAQGRLAEANADLEAVAAQFERRGSVTDAALVRLSIAENLVLMGSFVEAAEVCRHLIDRFTRAGMFTSAVVALQYLRASLDAGDATPAVVRHVRQFIERLASDPELLFAAPPERE